MKITNLERLELYDITPEGLGILVMVNSNTNKSKYLQALKILFSVIKRSLNFSQTF